MTDEIREAAISITKVSLNGRVIFTAQTTVEGERYIGAGDTPLEAIKTLFTVIYPDKTMRISDQAAFSPILKELHDPHFGETLATPAHRSPARAAD